MAKKVAPKQVYSITFTGQYRGVSEEGNPALKNFEIVFRMTERQKEKYSALGVLKHFGKNVMLAKYPDFQSLAKWKVANCLVEGKEDEVPDDLDLMNRDELLQYIEDYELQIDSMLFPEDGQLRQAIKDCNEDPAQFAINQSIVAKRIGATIEDTSELNELNKPENVVTKTTNKQKQEAEPKATKAAAKGKSKTELEKLGLA